MVKWHRYGLGLGLLLGLTPGIWAQLPPPGVGAAPPPVVAPAPAAPAPANLWSFLCPTPEQAAACKSKICKLKIVQLIGAGMKPVSALTGGVIGGCCPAVDPLDLLKPPTSAEGAAAQIKKDEAEAGKRRAAIRYLATADCHYWPEAQEAIINGLRADRNECVRFEAAVALGTGCCCNKATIRALTLTVGCGDDDGNPIECSPRVRAAAAFALDHCLHCFTFVTKAPPHQCPKQPDPPKEKPAPEQEPEPSKEKPEELPPPNKVPAPAPAPMTEQRKDTEKGPFNHSPVADQTAEYYKRVYQLSHEQILADARRSLAKAMASGIATKTPPAAGHSLIEIIQNASAPRNVPTPASSLNEPPAFVPAVASSAPKATGPQLLPATMSAAPVVPVPKTPAPQAAAPTQMPQPLAASVQAAPPLPPPSKPAATPPPQAAATPQPKPAATPPSGPAVPPQPGPAVPPPAQPAAAQQPKPAVAPVPPPFPRTRFSMAQPQPSGLNIKQTMASVGGSTPPTWSAHPSGAAVSSEYVPHRYQFRTTPESNFAVARQTTATVAPVQPVTAAPLPAAVPGPAQFRSPTLAVDSVPASGPARGPTPQPVEVPALVKTSAALPVPTPGLQYVPPPALVSPAKPALATAIPVVVKPSEKPTTQVSATVVSPAPAPTTPRFDQATTSVERIVFHLKSSPRPEERLAAARWLVNLDTLTREAAQALLAGTSDASPDVRVVCLRGLSRMNGEQAVQVTLNRLRNDPHPAVRQEVQFQLTSLKENTP